MNDSFNVAITTTADTVTILQALGSDVNVHTLPSVTGLCPICAERGLRAFDEPKLGLWFSCAVCGFYGDIVSLYAKKNCSDNIDDAIKALVGEKIIAPKAPDAMALYIQAEVNYRTAAAMTEKLMYRDNKRKAYDDSEYVQSIIHEAKFESIREFLCNDVFTVATVANLSRKAFGKEGNLFSGRTYKPYILTPTYKAPGDITGLAGFEFKYGRVAHDLAEYPGLGSVGLAFLRDSMLDLPFIVATDSGDFAFRMYTHCLRLGTTLPPLVLYNALSADLLPMFRRQRMYLTTDMVGLNTFIAAKPFASDAFIHALPTNTVEPSDVMWIGRTPHEFIDQIKKTAKPYYQALADYLLCLDDAQISEAISVLQLNGAQRMNLLGAVSGGVDKNRLSELLETAIYEKSVAIDGGRYLLVKTDIIDIRSKAGHTIRGCGAVPIIEKVTTAVNGVSYYIGRVKTQGSTYRFRVNADDFNSKWLVDFCRGRGHAISVSRHIAKDFEHICLQINTPEPADMEGELGNSTGGVYFPKVGITASGEIKESTQHADVDHPTKLLTLFGATTSRHDIKAWFAADNTDSVLAVYAAVCLNILRPRLSRFVVHSSSSTGRLDLASTASILEHNIGLEIFADDAQSLSEASTAAALYSLPAVINAESAVLPALDVGGFCSQIVLGNNAYVASACLSGGYTSLDCCDIAYAYGSSVFLHLLATLRKEHNELDAADPLLGLFGVWRKYVHAEYGIEPGKDDVMTRAYNRFALLPSTSSPVSARFLKCLRRLLDAGYASITFSKTAASAGQTTVVVAEDGVYLNFKQLKSVFAKHNIPYVGDLKLVRAFFDVSALVREEDTASSEGCVISRLYWDENSGL